MKNNDITSRKNGVHTLGIKPTHVIVPLDAVTKERLRESARANERTLGRECAAIVSRWLSRRARGVSK